MFLGTEKEQQALLSAYCKSQKNYLKRDLSYMPAIQNGFKDVAPELQGLLGEYECKISAIPQWYIDAMYAFNDYIDENATEEVKTKIYADAEHYNTTGELPESPSHFIQAVFNYNTITLAQFEEGLMPNGQRISKYLKKVCELTIGKTKDHMQAEWAKLIEKNTTQGGQRIVFSNAMMSLLGKSIYFENGMTSCQTFTRPSNEGTSTQLEGDLTDPNSLVCYVTSGAMQEPHELSGGPKHPLMKERIMVRLVRNNNGKIGIMVDRAYPKSAYGNEIYTVIMDYCDKNDLIFYEPSSFNRAKGGVEKAIVVANRSSSSERVYDAYPWQLPFCHYSRENGTCSENYLKVMTPCSSCKPVTKDICKLCNVELKLSQQEQRKCSQSNCSTCVKEDKNCCNCALAPCQKYGYKDNSSRVNDSRSKFNGLFADRYEVVTMTRKKGR